MTRTAPGTKFRSPIPSFRPLMALAPLALLLLSACGAYPVKKDNILASPIHIEIPVKDSVPVPSQDEFTTQVLQGLPAYLLDDLGRAKAVEMIGDRYRQKYVEKQLAGSERVEKALRDVFAGGSTFMHFNTDMNNRRKPSVYLSNFSVDWSGDTGTAKAVIASESIAGNFVNYGTSNISLGLSQQSSTETISADITSLSYVINCKYGHGTTCLFKGDVQILDDILIGRLRNATYTPEKKASITDIQRDIVSAFRRRYVPKDKVAYAKVEKTFRIDFASAKSRLQRSLGTFKYDGDTSAFTFEDAFDNPVIGTDTRVRHQYVLSLFPDRNDTVIVFSGEYGAFRDSFGGPDKYGKEAYEKAMNGYMATVSKLLSK